MFADSILHCSACSRHALLLDRQNSMHKNYDSISIVFAIDKGFHVKNMMRIWDDCFKNMENSIKNQQCDQCTRNITHRTLPLFNITNRRAWPRQL